MEMLFFDNHALHGLNMHIIDRNRINLPRSFKGTCIIFIIGQISYTEIRHTVSHKIINRSGIKKNLLS